MSTDQTDGFDGGVSAGDDSEPEIDFYGGKLASAFPLVFFVVWAIVQSGVLRVSDTTGLVAGMLVALIFGMFLVKGSWAGYANTIFAGMTQRVAATAIVAWLWAGMFAETIQTGQFVSGLVWAAEAAGIGGAVFPAATFILAGLLATGIGSGYGTTVAFTALFFPAGVALGANPALLFGAILSGAVFGDNLAPVSDTTIVSAVTQDADIGGVVASRFKYAGVAAVLSFAAYLGAGAVMDGISVAGDASAILGSNVGPTGLLHLLSMATVIGTAIAGRHIVEAISWGIVVAFVLNVVFGLADVSEMLVFRASDSLWIARELSVLPFVEAINTSPEGVTSSVGGSLYAGAQGFFPLIVLVLLIVAGAQIMIRGGGFRAIQDFLLESVATTVRRAELTMVLGTAFVNSMITINTAAEIAIAPYIARLGERFNINSYRRANILDANTSALGYIFPWSGGVLVGYAALADLPTKYDWFTRGMVVDPTEVVPFVFHGWLLVGVFVFSALTGFGLEYISDRESEEVARA
ncbi:MULTISPECIES: Na+/H+ antiporter NhaC family protein [Halobacterium]|uniref:Na+/H+ antiporter n=3 Tax=Halobacterium salinarum TaxID=2242 RepID=Q9HS26_HALSA|nr:MULTISPECIES: Na+/H+ antiporter NhaC family protein [Halobacterium]AAG18982.1 Na+/H+ antiporter [Halobacterium salinarum NRC-1]MBB6089815.1 Na+/H+ antiporter NhaC [Halobacterium salinarum]MCF2164094.1 Na+/H+ antiporter NhaC family protein [Halobacterium salinarum]MCF2167830.1 Na+/H+ antiporter NhaC family protein [Halobacterium salinarum]MCF2207665.1 Na+/H+ antiporter NhaC family protein [Halobacterium salinarum]